MLENLLIYLIDVLIVISLLVINSCEGVGVACNKIACES